MKELMGEIADTADFGCGVNYLSDDIASAGIMNRGAVKKEVVIFHSFENNCKELESMFWKQMQEVVANCEDFCEVYYRRPYFYITGGDPILHPDFWRLLELLKSRNIPFAILGNPFHLDLQVCLRLKEYGRQKYQLSLDGMKKTP